MKKAETDLRPIYQDPQKFDQTYRREEDIPFYVGESERSGSPVLEIGCGTGRVALEIAKRGIAVTGVDLSPSMLERAKSKAQESAVALTLVHSDSLEFELGTRFNLVCIPFNPLSEYETLPSWRALLARISAHLAPSGRLIFDIYNPLLFPGVPDPEKPPFAEFLTYNRFLKTPAGKLDELRFWYLFPAEIRWVLDQGGFSVTSCYGHFDKTPYGPDEPFQILVSELKRP